MTDAHSSRFDGPVRETPIRADAYWWAAVVIGLLAFSATWFALPAVWAQASKPVVVLDAVLGIVSFVLLALRERALLPIAWLVNIEATLSSSSVGAAAILLAAVATRRRWSEILPLAALTVTSALVFETYVPPGPRVVWPWSAMFVTILVGLLVAWGMYVGARRDLVAALEERAREAEREHAERIAKVKSEERARIAREMHDVVAHRISLVALRAGALTYRAGPEENPLHEDLMLIAESSRTALAELRDLLGLLRRSGEVTDELPEPQPTLLQIDDLLEQAREAGTAVEVHLSVDLADLATDTSRHGYRMVQECLTNVRKHAPGASAVVTISGRPGQSLEIGVENSPATRRVDPGIPSSGLGLIGLGERAEIAGGVLASSPTPRGGFCVRIRLPWKRAGT